MTSYKLVLFLHVLLVVVLFGAGAINHLGLLELRAATRVETVRAWSRTLHRLEPVFPVGVVLLFATGADLVHEGFRWSNGWVVAAVVGLLAVEGLGGTVLRSGLKTLDTALARAADGPVPRGVRSAAMQPSVWMTTHAVTGIVTGILFVMVVKPSGAAAFLAVAFAGLAGAATAMPLLRRVPAARPGPATHAEPAAAAAGPDGARPAPAKRDAAPVEPPAAPVAVAAGNGAPAAAKTPVDGGTPGNGAATAAGTPGAGEGAGNGAAPAAAPRRDGAAQASPPAGPAPDREDGKAPDGATAAPAAKPARQEAGQGDTPARKAGPGRP
jgi:hypothetical protein